MTAAGRETAKGLTLDTGAVHPSRPLIEV